MIRVNLVGASRKKKSARAGLGISMPTSMMPFLLALIVIGSAAGGFWWYKSVTDQSADLDRKIDSAQKQKAELDKFIKENAIYEGRKKTLENRLKVVDSLKRNKVNPVLALDVVSEAIEKTQYVWLTNLDQNNAILSMSGTGTSLNAISDFIKNLEDSGYVRPGVALDHATDSAGNYAFSLKCEFIQPKTAAAATTGGN